jgi:N-acylneuraminate cytidylyltransferase
MTFKYLAIIPAKEKSQGITNKNIVSLSHKPLVDYTFQAAKSCHLIEHIIVSTDSNEITTLAKNENIEVFARSKDHATDNARLEDVILEMTEIIQKYENIILLQPTSPLRTNVDIENAIHTFENARSKSCFSVCSPDLHPYKMIIENKYGDLETIRHPEDLNSPRQSLPKAYQQNGAIYIFNTQEFITNKTFFLKPLSLYNMPQERSIDIDTELDLKMAEYLISLN